MGSEESMNRPTDRPTNQAAAPRSRLQTHAKREEEEAEEGPTREGTTTHNHLFPSHSPLSLVIMLRGPGRVYITTTTTTINSPKARTRQRDSCDFIFFYQRVSFHQQRR